MAEIVALLQTLTVGDNAVRQAAEHQYDQLKKGAETAPNLPLILLQVVNEASVELHIRQLAAVLLRRK